MTSIAYVTGDATNPQGDGPKIICHICNDRGVWGKGFVLALSRRWKEPEAEYRAWASARRPSGFGLGAVQLVQVESSVWVASMIAQHGVGRSSFGPPIRYVAVEECLKKVADEATRLGATVHMPRIGCGLAQGRWDRIEPLIEEQLCNRGVRVTVYDLE